VHVSDLSTGKDLFQPLAHQAAIGSVLFSPDGALLAVATGDGSVTLWDAASGKLKRRLAAPANRLRLLAFSRDGQNTAVSGGDSVELWRTSDALAGNAPQTTLKLSSPASRVLVNYDGSRVVTLHTNQPPVAWESATGRRLFMAPPQEQTRGAAIDARANRLAVISAKYEVAVWDLTSNLRLSSIQSDSPAIDQVALTPDGERVVLVFHAGFAQVFWAATGSPVSKPMPHLYEIGTLELDPNGKRILTGSRDYKARVWDLASGEPIGEPIQHPQAVNFARFAGDGPRVLLATVGYGRVRHLRAWDLRRPVEPLLFQPPGARDLNAVRLSPNGKFVVVGAWSPETAISIYDAASGNLLLGSAAIGGPAYGIEFTPDLKTLTVATAAGSIHGWSVGGWRPLWPPARQPGGIQPTAMSPDGRILAAGGKTLCLWDVETGKLIRELKPSAPLKGLRFSPTGDRILTGGVDGMGAIWETSSGALLASLKGHSADILCVQFSPDGRRALTGSYDSTVRIWDADPVRPTARPSTLDTRIGRETTPPLRHQGEISHATFSPDGKKVATAARDGTARIWSAETGQPLSDWMPHQGTVQTVQFDPQGRRLVTRDQSGFRLWDAATGEAITIHHTAPVTGGLGLDSPTMRETFSPDGKRVFLGLSMNAASLWDIPDPPPGVPAWFPGFLEAVAGLHVEQSGEFLPVPAERFLEFRQRAAAFDTNGYYAAWVRKYLGLQKL
jgi:WD40 repeat protein